jgi:hypothetical protein
MIEQGFGYSAIKRRLWQVAQTDFPRTPFPVGVVQGAMKLSIGIKFWFFSRCQTFTRFAVPCRPRYRRESARPVLLSPYRRVVTPANFKAVPLSEISAWIALLCEEGRASGSSLDEHFRKL